MDPSVVLSEGEAGCSIASASIDSQSIVDATGHASYPHPSFRPPGIPRAHPPHLHPSSLSSPHVNFRYVNSPYASSSHNSPNRAHWSPDHRRNSSLPPRQYNQFYDGVTPTDPRAPTHSYRPRPRSPSTSSASSSSSCSSESLTTEYSARSSPGNSHCRRSAAPPFSLPNRRHSSSSLPHDYNSNRLNTRYNHHRAKQVLQPHQEQARTSYFESHLPAGTPPPRPNAKGLNVRWRDVNSVFGSAPGTPGEEARVRHRGRKIAGERTREGRRN